jgi:hypothetical protein
MRCCRTARGEKGPGLGGRGQARTLSHTHSRAPSPPALLVPPSRQTVLERIGIMHQISSKVSEAMAARTFSLPQAASVPSLQGARVWRDIDDGGWGEEGVEGRGGCSSLPVEP